MEAGRDFLCWASLPLQLPRRPLLLRRWVAAVGDGGEAPVGDGGVAPVGMGGDRRRWGWVGGGSGVGSENGLRF
ncbi:hypothetical protein KY290_005051 [Solanum tuberosum]|uniref:Uncharacterized protein n=1 Tax=Solanum tuberosum TaxID=4113 RepID=A0ABQ7WD00_SOLTU|nr:hypothetical protein KY290_005051 [Solanum tuberosum]